MLAQLEADLYSCRDLWSTALDEYDTIAEIHHQELIDGTLAALVAKFMQVPLIATYKQSAIRAQEVSDWNGVARWASRGIEVYGDDAARLDDVADLRKRLEKANEKRSLA